MNQSKESGDSLRNSNNVNNNGDNIKRSPSDKNGKDMANSTINLSTSTHKCPSCGAAFHYSPTVKKLLCDHCGTTKEICAKPQIEIPYTDGAFMEFDKKNKDVVWENNELVSFRCNDCGAVSVMDRLETATICPFCKTPQIAVLDNVDSIKPNAILPFSVSKEAALASAKKWLKGKVFANYKVRKNILVNDISGIYIPIWTFDFDTIADYNGVLGRKKTRTIRVGKTIKTQVYTEYFNVRGILDGRYDDMIIEASSKISEKEMKGFGNFNTYASVAYDDDYIAGFSAQRYDKNIESCLSEAKSKVYSDYEKKIINKYNADCVKSLNIEVEYRKTTFKYVLVPLYLANYVHRGREYRLLINGANGRANGNFPLSPTMVSLTALLGLGVLALILYFVFFR